MFYFDVLENGTQGPFSIEELKLMTDRPKGSLRADSDDDFRQLAADPDLMKFLGIESFNFTDEDLGKSDGSNNAVKNEELEDSENSEEEMDDSEDSGNVWDYSNEDEDNWDAYTDGQYGDYEGPIDPELIGL